MDRSNLLQPAAAATNNMEVYQQQTPTDCAPFRDVKRQQLSTAASPIQTIAPMSLESIMSHNAIMNPTRSTSAPTPPISRSFSYHHIINNSNRRKSNISIVSGAYSLVSDTETESESECESEHVIVEKEVEAQQDLILKQQRRIDHIKSISRPNKSIETPTNTPNNNNNTSDPVKLMDFNRADTKIKTTTAVTAIAALSINPTIIIKQTQSTSTVSLQTTNINECVVAPTRKQSPESSIKLTPRPAVSDIACLDAPIAHVGCDACKYCDDVCKNAQCQACIQKAIVVASETKMKREKSSWCCKFKQKLTWCQIRRQTNKDSCWIVVHKTVYDATKYIASNTHPGGTKLIWPRAGKDASDDFRFHSRAARNILGKMSIGVLVECKCETLKKVQRKSWDMSEW